MANMESEQQILNRKKLLIALGFPKTNS